ncbi:MAG: Flp pilus assembly complex ATPase component TadA [Deltaproteobacteria bacterium]|nr:Flp pilus assembly complex ATPase component TadA [Deltaproteobacteria bacterium]
MGQFRRIGEILVDEGRLKPESVHAALGHAKRRGVRTGQACVDLGFITEEALAEAVASQWGLEYLDCIRAADAELDERAMGAAEADVFERHRFALLKLGSSTVFAVSDPAELFAIGGLSKAISEKTGGRVRLAVAAPSAIERLLDKKGPLPAALKGALKNGREGVISSKTSAEDMCAADSPAVRLVDAVLHDAIANGASDIHIEACPGGAAIKYRIDGALRHSSSMEDDALRHRVISRIKVLASLDISESRLPQDGRFSSQFRERAVDLRVSVMPGIHGEDAVIRILDKEHLLNEFKALSLEGLGLNDADVRSLRKAIHAPYGMVLATGPTGSGKTTTLYAALSEINTGADKIVTIEDPVEYELKGALQIQVNEKKGLTFARGLRSILRHDPDRVMVGEIRDTETADIAVQAALTGHLVLTTVHANNAFDVIGRLLHMGIEPYNFISSLNCVFAQRLIRLICAKCKRPAEAGAGGPIFSGIGQERGGERRLQLYEGRGCAGCGYTGYSGRKAIGEALVLTDEVREMIAGRRPFSMIRKKAAGTGMTSLRQSALRCLERGETTLQEINRVTSEEC